MNIRKLFRPIGATMIVLALTVLAGCGKPSPSATAHPDAALLEGRWQQFIPVDSMPQQLSFEPSGNAAVDDETGRWRLQGGMLVVRQGGGERSYSYTVSGYMMTLYDGGSDTSCFYINPEVFATDAAGNAELAGQWAAFDSWGKLIFDGKGGLASMVHTEAGDTRIDQTYAARDGILQAEDTSGNFSYNLYSMSQDGALLLAETVDYDEDVKHWTPYWKRVESDSAILGQWARVISSNPAGEGLPGTLLLQGGGQGKAGAPGIAPVSFTWEYFEGGFLLLWLGEDHLYAWCGAEGGVLFVGNPNVDECWYVDDSRYKPTAEPIKELSGRWQTEDGTVSLEVNGGSFVLRGQDGGQASFSALAADGMLRLKSEGGVVHAAYTLQDGELRLYGAGMPVIGQMEMPVALRPAGQ